MATQSKIYYNMTDLHSSKDKVLVGTEVVKIPIFVLAQIRGRLHITVLYLPQLPYVVV